MRIEPEEISETGELRLDIIEPPVNWVFVISEGKAKMAAYPSHTNTSIVTYKGKVKHVNFDEEEDF